MHTIKGFTWLEILICLTLLSVLLLGIDATQLTLLSATRRAADFAIATQQLAILCERLTALGDADPNELLEQWNQQTSELLSHANGHLIGRYPSYQAELCWGTKPYCLRIGMKT